MRTSITARAIALLALLAALLAGGAPARAQDGSVHLALGNPSGAVSDPAQPHNYLIARAQYALSYSRDRGIPTWVSWHLAAGDLGATGRYGGPFIPDAALPPGWYQVKHGDYTGSGYDRGHMTPSADRTASAGDNQATFILTNVLPQAPALNQGLWAQLEDHARALVGQGNELYIVAGGAGSLGTLAGGRLTIPAATWKALLILPAADGDDAARVTAATPLIAIWATNDDTTRGRRWEDYTTSVACIEQRTGLDLFAALPDEVEQALAGAPCPDAPPADQLCFAETGQCIAGPIRAYWEANGGLAAFGFPITAQASETVEGAPLQAQWFERDRLEIQPGGTITAGRLGAERLEQLGTPWQLGPGQASPGCLAFPVTGYQACGAFAAYWEEHGGLERFGYPLTGVFVATLEGQTYMVQYFERRRFELHPEVGPDTVLLGLLGREVLAGRQAMPPTPTPEPLPPSYNGCAPDPSADRAPNDPVTITAIDKAAETVTLQNVGPDPLSLDGWHMCSVRGGQQHPIGGPLAPGETKVFPGPSSQIWSNGSSDPGALYDAAGRLVSYWPD